MREKMKNELFEKTGCDIQHDGWCCNTCFHNLNLDLKEDIHEYWEAVLALRGDYPDIPKRPDLTKELYEALQKKGWYNDRKRIGKNKCYQDNKRA